MVTYSTFVEASTHQDVSSSFQTQSHIQERSLRLFVGFFLGAKKYTFTFTCTRESDYQEKVAMLFPFSFYVYRCIYEVLTIECGAETLTLLSVLLSEKSFSID